MSELSLTVVEDPTRMEFGAYRTVCGCRECTINCEHIPGYLIPSDLVRIQAVVAPLDVRMWAVTNLRASPGALVLKGGLPLRVYTLVPDVQSNGWCKFLESSEDGKTKKCKIHDNSPFGCAFFDAHQEPKKTSQLSSYGLTAIMQDFVESGLYAQIWFALYSLGRVAPCAVEVRQRLTAAWEAELRQRVLGK